MEKEKLVHLVTTAQAGDSDALNELFNAFYNDVYYFALKTVKDEDLACDITQEAFVEIINTLGNLKEPAAFVTWMKQITYHQCTRYFKKKKDVLVDENEDGDTIFDTMTEDRTEFIPDEAVDQEDFRATIMAMIDQLSDEQRAATMMYYFDEMSVKEIAQAQGVGENTVKGRLSYARKAIKKSVEDYEKKNNIKLHSLGILPLLLWLFRNYGKAMPVVSAKAVAEGVCTATGVGICVAAESAGVATAGTATTAAAAGTAATAGAGAATTATAVGLGAKIAAIPLAIKITAAAVAVAVAVSGVAIGLGKNSENTTDPTTMQSQTTDPKEEGPTIPSNPDEDPTNPQEDPTTPPKKPFEPFTVPAGCTYYSLSNSTIYSAGERVTVPFSEGDYLETNHYFYRYHAGTDEDHPYEGWNVYTNTDDYGTYEPISETVLGLPVAYMDGTFAGCKYMTTTPEIPKTVKFMRNTFKECRMITEPPVLPEGVEDLSYAFAMCSWLKTPPEIPDSVTSMKGTFFLCLALEAAPRIPEGIEDLTETFQSCGRMKEAPELPEGLRILDRTFFRCDGLVTAPRIPDSVVSMRETFCECDSMVTASDFPPNVEDISYAYKDTLISQAPAIPASVRWATSVFSGCYRLNGEVVIHAQFAANCYDNIFYGTHQEILLSGTSSQLEEIAAQYDNITVTQ